MDKASGFFLLARFSAAAWQNQSEFERRRQLPLHYGKADVVSHIIQRSSGLILQAWEGRRFETLTVCLVQNLSITGFFN